MLVPFLLKVILLVFAVRVVRNEWLTKSYAYPGGWSFNIGFTAIFSGAIVLMLTNWVPLGFALMTTGGLAIATGLYVVCRARGIF